MEGTTPYLILFTLALPLSAYVWAAFRTPKTRVSTLPDYYIAFRQVDDAPYANSSLAYAFQVATLFPFFYWGVQGQILPAIVNAICWGIGICLFRYFVPSMLNCLSSSAEPRTLHGVLGDFYNSRLVHTVSASVTIIGMIGVALAEAYWGMQILKILVPKDTPAYYVVVLGALLFVLVYVWQGGTWGSMKTDMLQLAFSYLGFSAVFLFGIISIINESSAFSPAIGILSLLMVVGGCLSVTIRMRTRIALVARVSYEPTNGDKESRLSSSAPHALSLYLSRATLGPVDIQD